MPQTQSGQVPVLAKASHRSITSKMTPGIASTPYWKIINGTDNSNPNLTSPILSIIQLKLAAGLSVLDQHTTAARLWSASLEYVATIPGCSALRWGTQRVVGNHSVGVLSERICLLISWESSLHWAKFQDSFGLLLMREVLAKDERISNRCIRLSQPISLASARSLGLASFVFDNRVSSRGCESFSERWRAEKPPNGAIGAWLEGDAVWPTPVLPPDRLAILEKAQGDLRNMQSRIFVVLSFDEESPDHEMSNGYVASLEATLTIGGHTAIINKFTLSFEQPRLQSYFDVHQITPRGFQFPQQSSLGSLLTFSPRRQYSERSGMSHNIDQIHENTVKDFYSKSRLFPGPRGEMRTKMGDMCEYGPRYADNAISVDAAAVDIIELGLEQEILNNSGVSGRAETIRQLFMDFRSCVRELEGCEEMCWARDDEGMGGYLAVIYWTSSELRRANAQSIQNLTQDLISGIRDPGEWLQPKRHKSNYSDASGFATPTSTVGTITPISMTDRPGPSSIMSTTTIPSSIRTRRSSKSPRAAFPLLEMTTFEIPDDQESIDLLKIFYNALQMTSSLNARVVTQTIPLACNTKDYFLSSPVMTSNPQLSTPPSTPPNGSTRMQFTALIGWKSQAAMNEWYADFSSACQADNGQGYERLGHKIDALQSLGIENVQTRLVAVTSDVFGARRTVMWECGDENWEARDRERETARRRKERPGSISGSLKGAVQNKRKEREKRMSMLSQYSSRAS